MKRMIVFSAGLAVLVGTSALLAGCESTGGNGKHDMAAQEDGHVIGCKMCYDEAVRVRETHPKAGAATRDRIIKKHMCPDCKTEMVLYNEGDTPMIKCAHCAPEGVPCSKCMPPKTE